MKPFNLERALAGDPVGTREGKNKVVQLFYASKAKKSQRVLVILDNGFAKAYQENGLHFPYKQSPFDLVMLPKTRTYWYAVMKNCYLSVITTGVCDSLDSVKSAVKRRESLGEVLLEIRSIALEENE